MENPYTKFMNPWDKVYSEITGLPFPVSAAASETVYNFTSYDSTGEVEYATGTAIPIGEGENSRIKIKVLTNSVEGFAGKCYWLSENVLEHVGDDTKFPLYETSDAQESIGIQVSVSLD